MYSENEKYSNYRENAKIRKLIAKMENIKNHSEKSEFDQTNE